MAVKDNEKGRANVGGVVAFTKVEIPRIFHAQRGCQFEEQLKEIDATIFGDTADTTNHHHAEQSTGMTEAIQTNVQSPYVQVKEEVSTSNNELQGKLNNNTMTLPGSQMLNKPTNQAQVKSQTLSPFSIGLTSPSSSTKPKLKKSNQATLKKG